MPVIRAARPTIVKMQPKQKSQLEPQQYFAAPEGKELWIVGLSQDVEKHGLCTFDPHVSVYGQQFKKLFVFLPDWEGWDQIILQKIAAAGAFTQPGSDEFILPIEWRSQVDNSDQTGQGKGWRQCALTSTVMFLEALKGPQWIKEFTKGWGQPEDRYASLLTQRGYDTTDPQAHEWMLNNQFGIPVTFRYDLSLQDGKDTLDRALGLVTGVRWKGGGHYQYLVGKCLRRGGLYYHDPFGDRVLTDTRAIDEYRTIGSNGAKRYWPIEVIKDAWLDLGDRAGWGLMPGKDLYGFHYKKPSVNLDQVPATSPPSPKSSIPEGCSIVKAKQATMLKSKPVQSSQLPPEEKTAIDKDEEIVCVVSQAEAGHILITKPGAEKIEGRDCWYAFKTHFDISTPGGAAAILPGAKLSKGDIEKLAQSIGVEPRALAAVIKVEASGSGFLPSGRPKILYEAHIMSELTDSRFDDSHPKLSSYSWDRGLYLGGEGEWSRLEAAMKLDREAALMSCSWGMGQVLGRNWTDLDYRSIDEFVKLNSRSEADQVECMIRFIKINGIVDALRQKRWAAFARVYNGPEYAANEYDARLQEAYDELA